MNHPIGIAQTLHLFLTYGGTLPLGIKEALEPNRREGQKALPSDSISQQGHCSSGENSEQAISCASREVSGKCAPIPRTGPANASEITKSRNESGVTVGETTQIFTKPENSITLFLDREEGLVEVCCEIVELEEPESSGYWNPKFSGSVTLGDCWRMDGTSIELTDLEFEQAELDAHKHCFPNGEKEA